MTASERRALIEKPFPRIVTHTSSYPWAGCLVTWPEDGQSFTKRIEKGLPINLSLRESLADIGVVVSHE